MVADLGPLTLYKVRAELLMHMQGVANFPPWQQHSTDFMKGEATYSNNPLTSDGHLLE